MKMGRGGWWWGDAARQVAVREVDLLRGAAASLSRQDAEELAAESGPLVGRARAVRLAFRWRDQVRRRARAINTGTMNISHGLVRPLRGRQR